MKKSFIMALALVLVLGIAIGGTVAWLTASTTPVVNTFTTSDISVTLTETPNTDTDGDGKADAWQAQMIPGYSYTKDPVVTVSGNVDCYLFVKFEVENNTGTLADGTTTFSYLGYTTELTSTYGGWTQGTGDNGDGVPTNVWYRVVKTTEETKSWHLLVADKVSISNDLTKDNMPASDKTPSLTFTAYASQLWKSNDSSQTDTENQFTAAEAWAILNPATTTD